MNKPVAQQAVSHEQAYDILTRAQELIEHGWVQGKEAIDHEGHAVVAWDEKAVAWCEIGAIRAITHYIDGSDQDHAGKDGPAHRYCVSLLGVANANVLEYGSVPSVNDDPVTDHARVIRMFERARAFVAGMAKQQ